METLHNLAPDFWANDLFFKVKTPMRRCDSKIFRPLFPYYCAFRVAIDCDTKLGGTSGDEKGGNAYCRNIQNLTKSPEHISPL